MSFDRDKARQAVSEFAHTFLVLVAPAFFALAAGIRVGDGGDQTTVLPNLSTVKAFVFAMIAAACLSALKAVWWFLTGTKV